MPNITSKEGYSFRCAVNSFISTYIAGVFHPLGLIKTRLQSHDGNKLSYNLVPKYNGILHGFKTIYKQEGFMGLYKGFHVSMLSQAISTSLFFCIYQYQKLNYLRNGHNEMNAVAIASTQASILGTLVTQPLWVIKTRMVLNTKPSITDMQSFKLSYQQIIKQHGYKGFARGFSISLLLSVTGVIQMYLYEAFKKGYEALAIPQSQGLQKNFICGGISKFLTVAISYPFTTIRTRVQQNQFRQDKITLKYNNTLQIVGRTLKFEGVSGFYKGFKANLLKGILQKGVYFYFYQLFKVIFMKQCTLACQPCTS